MRSAVTNALYEQQSRFPSKSALVTLACGLSATLDDYRDGLMRQKTLQAKSRQGLKDLFIF